MKQVFVNQSCQVDQRVLLNEKEAHHLFDVLRIQKEEVVRVVNQDSKVFLAYPDKRPYLYLFNEVVVENEDKHITLCASLIKQDKWEWMLQKACELGVTRIVPFTSEYSIIHLDKEKQKKKLDRWSTILLNACKQCNRNDLVDLQPIQTLDTLVNFQSDLNLVAYEKEGDPSKHIANYLKQDAQSITVCIGPEGGFSPSEIQNLKAEHFQSCSLGKNILRAETAACYILSAIEYQRHVKENQ